MEERRSERAARFAQIFSRSRYDAGKSQEFMAAELGVSKKTVQNWEKGISSPSFFQGSEWFHALGLNPMPYYLAFVYPDMNGMQGSSTDDKIVEALNSIIKQMSITDKRALLYLLFGNHGSSSKMVLQMLLAHLHTPMKDRVAHASVIAQNYEMEEKLGNIVCQGNIMPDMEALNKAIAEGKRSVMENKYGYSGVEYKKE